MEPVTKSIPHPSASATGLASRWGRIEAPLLLIGLVIFFLLNFATADKAPTVWSDEVMYQDPAVNLYQGHGFHSGAWFAQDIDKFWAGNVPLYQGVLFGWLKLFGFSLQSVRSFHYALISLAVLLAWLGIRRLNLVRHPAQRLLFCLLVCTCNPSFFVCRFARPESLGLVLLAFALLAFSFRSRWLLFFALVGIGVLLTWNGLQLAVYTGLVCALVFLWGYRPCRPGLFALCGGCALGGCLLYLFYRHFGVWEDFINSIRHFTIAHQNTHYPHVTAYGHGLGNKLRQVPELYSDYSFIPLFVLALWMALQLSNKGELRLRSPFTFGIVASLVIPLSLHTLGVYPRYYHWMAFFPLALGVCAEYERWMNLSLGRLYRFSFISLVALACLMGWPRRLIVASMDWEARRYGPVMELAAPYVSGDKMVYTEFAGYYAAKQNSALVVLPLCLPRLTARQKASVSVAIVYPGTASEVTRYLGGEWRDSGAAIKPDSSPRFLNLHENLDSRQYQLKILLREPSSSVP